jgi:molybdopterin converting factor small subunit
LRYTVQMFGLPPEITRRSEVEVELWDGAGMAEVVAVLRSSIPALEGAVIRPGEDRLQEEYKFNVNGRFYFDGMDFRLHRGDKIALLIPATGG